jgi:hypothetical protein
LFIVRIDDLKWSGLVIELTPIWEVHVTWSDDVDGVGVCEIIKSGDKAFRQTRFPLSCTSGG